MKVKINSKNVEKGDTFVAIKGVKKDGHDYIEEAIKNGATKIVAEHGLYSVDTLIVKDTYEYLKNYLKEFDLSGIKLIGITGTNGKTTSCYLLHHLLNELGIKTSYIGTIGFYIGEKIRNLNNTTPNIYEIYEMLIESIDKGCKYVVMEVSSHALDQDRIGDLRFEYVAFTNLTQDHLDYHKNMQEYAKAKQKLFLKVNNKAIINNDDEYKNYFLLDDNKNITYGFSESDYKISEYSIDINKTIFKLNDIMYETNLIGKHNIYNILISIIILKDMLIDDEIIKKLLINLPYPKGRMDIVDYNTNKIIIDYAHTPDAVSKIITSVKELNPNNIYVLIGCGGERDRYKRPQMAKIATDLATYAIFTSDNPRSEDPNEIIKDMVDDLDNKNYEIVTNRQEAIKKGIQKLKLNDILLILGKGHEDYQIIGNDRIHFDDKETVLEII